MRTSLLPGLLKTISSNRHHAVPIKIFEVSDVGFIDLSMERKSRNERHFAAAVMGKTSGFEQVHGLLDRVLLMLKSAFITREEGLSNEGLGGYWIEEVDGEFFSFFLFVYFFVVFGNLCADKMQILRSSRAIRRVSNSVLVGNSILLVFLVSCILRC